MTPIIHDDEPRMSMTLLYAEDHWHQLRNEFYDELLDDGWADGAAWREAATMAGDAMDRSNPASVRY